ncbi:MAG: uracil-DNA glycosylase family protein [Candidatus Gracilibacteria bacterium]
MAINPKALPESGSELLLQIHQQVDGCIRCELFENNNFYVPGMGTQQTDILLVGEGPGKNEDLQGLPFVGASGRFLDELLGSIGLSREKIYITNVVKCRPPENRDPKPNEIEACDNYLEAQIMVINPKIIITLGRYSMAKFLPGVKISEVHGKPKKRQSDGRIIFPCYHPAVALYNGGMRETLKEDFARIPKILALIS